MNGNAVQFVALLVQFLAFVLSFITLFAGQHGQLEDVYLVSLNTSKMGRDVLAGTNLFALNESNIIYAIASSKPKPSGAVLNSTTPPTRVSSIGDDVALNRRQVTPPPPPVAPPPSIASSLVTSLIDYVLSKLGVDPGGNLAGFVKKSATTATNDISKGFTQCSATVQSQIVNDISLDLADSLAQMAASLRGSVTGAAKSGALRQKRDGQPASLGQQSNSLVRLAEFNMSAEQAEQVSHALAQEIQGNDKVSSAMLESMALVITGLNGTSAARTYARQLNAQEPPDLTLDSSLGNTNGLQALSGVIIATAPTISQGLKQQLLKSMNSGVEKLKSRIPVYDWYTFYNTQMCWGNFDYANDGKAKRNTHGCSTTDAWRDVNIAPVVQRILEGNGFSAKVPDSIGLGKGVEQTFAGLRAFTRLVYAINIIGVLNFSCALIVTIVGVVASIMKVKGKWLRICYLLGLSVCGGAASMVYSNTMVMTFALGGMGLMLPGSMSSAGVIVHTGSKLVGLLWLNTVFACIGATCWFVLWLGTVKKDEYKRGVEREKDRAEERALAGMNMDLHVRETKNPVPVMLDQGVYRF